MHDLRDYKTLTPKQITTAISQLNHKQQSQSPQAAASAQESSQGGSHPA